VHTTDGTTASWCEMLWSSNQKVNGPIQKVGYREYCTVQIGAQRVHLSLLKVVPRQNSVPVRKSTILAQFPQSQDLL